MAWWQLGNMLLPWTQFKKWLWAQHWHLVIFFLCFNFTLMIRAANKFAQDMTGQLLWHMQNCELIWLLLSSTSSSILFIIITIIIIIIVVFSFIIIIIIIIFIIVMFIVIIFVNMLPPKIWQPKYVVHYDIARTQIASLWQGMLIFKILGHCFVNVIIFLILYTFIYRSFIMWNWSNTKNL